MPHNTAATALAVVAHGSIDDATRDSAHTTISQVLRRHGLADGAVVRLSGAECGRGPGLAQVNLRVHGAPARIQVAGPTMEGAIAAAATRLDRQIRRLIVGDEPWPWPDPQRRPLAMPTVSDVRRVKEVPLRASSACQAVAAMNAMDYDVHLYRDGHTGDDAVVYRSGPTGVRLARQHHMSPPAASESVELTVSVHRTPELAVEAAVARLAQGWLPFLFFTDPVCGRGRLLYRRYDGRLTLIQPSTR